MAELIDKRVVFEGRKIRLEVHTLRENGRTFEREVCVHPGAVTVLPVLPDRRIMLIKVRRYAAGEYLIELPAGTLEPGEPPEITAGRELEEETGYVAGTVTHLGMFYTSPGILSEIMHCYVMTDLTQTQQALEEGEDIELLPTPVDDVISMCMDGRIKDGKTIAAMLSGERRWQRLEQEWTQMNADKNAISTAHAVRSR